MKTRRKNYLSTKASETSTNLISRKSGSGKKSKKMSTGASDKNFDDIYENYKDIPDFKTKFKKFLRNFQTSTYFKQTRRKFPRRRIVAHYPLELVQADTLNFRNLRSPKNRGFNYVLVVIDTFSKKLWARPLKRLSESETCEGLKAIISEMEYPPILFMSDKGKEFLNKSVQTLFDRLGVKSYYVTGPHKAALAERVIKTVKQKIERYLFQNETKVWLPVLQAVVENYNNSFHSSIKMAPNEVNSKNRSIVYERLYPNIKDHVKPKLSIGDKVRILEEKGLFTKGYKRNWSREIYKISKCYSQGEVEFYRVETLNGHILPQKRYLYQLNPVSK